MKTYQIFSTLLALLLLSLCTACNLTSDQRFNDTTVVITGMLYAGEPISKENAIYVGLTIDINELSLDTMRYSMDGIDKVEIFDVSTPDDKKILTPFTIPIFVDNHPKIGWYDADDDFVIESGSTYKIIAHHSNYPGIDGSYTTSAETKVPVEFGLKYNPMYTQNPDDLNNIAMIHTTIDNEHPLIILPILSAPEPIVIYMEYYCREEPPRVMTMGDYLGITITIETNEDYESAMDGYPRKNKYIDRLVPIMGNTGITLTIPFNQVNYLFYGKYQTTIFIVDTNFYEYVYKNQGYLHGGVQNGGIGYFGSAYRQTWLTNVVKE